MESDDGSGTDGGFSPCAELTETLDERNFKGKIGIKIGPVTAKFNGEASFTKMEESNYELTF